MLDPNFPLNRCDPQGVIYRPYPTHSTLLASSSLLKYPTCPLLISQSTLYAVHAPVHRAQSGYMISHTSCCEIFSETQRFSQRLWWELISIINIMFSNLNLPSTESPAGTFTLCDVLLYHDMTNCTNGIK